MLEEVLTEANPCEEPITFSEALEATNQRRRILLLGNGFSIGVHKAFGYPSLFQHAVDEEPAIARFFKPGDSNFETALEGCSDESEARSLRASLIRAVAAVHPEHSLKLTEEQCLSCRDFLEPFVGRHRNPAGILFTTNYDMLLHWVLSRQGKNSGTKQRSQLKCWDGFAADGEWNPAGSAQAYYLHGAVHIYQLPHPDLPHLQYTRMLRYEWQRPLLKQVNAHLAAGSLPVFVAQGNSQKKKADQREWGYLQAAKLKFKNVCTREPDTALFTFGHSFGESDNHIAEQIGEGTLRDVFIGVFSDRDRTRARELAASWTATRAATGGPPVSVRCFDSAECAVWERRA